MNRQQILFTEKLKAKSESMTSMKIRMRNCWEIFKKEHNMGWNDEEWRYEQKSIRLSGEEKCSRQGLKEGKVTVVQLWIDQGPYLAQGTRGRGRTCVKLAKEDKSSKCQNGKEASIPRHPIYNLHSLEHNFSFGKVTFVLYPKYFLIIHILL